jgi:hypothetical protein
MENLSIEWKQTLRNAIKAYNGHARKYSSIKSLLKLSKSFYISIADNNYYIKLSVEGK